MLIIEADLNDSVCNLVMLFPPNIFDEPIITSGLLKVKGFFNLNLTNTP